MYKFICFVIFSVFSISLGLHASPGEDIEGLSTQTYNIRIIDNCTLDEEECIKLKYIIYNKITKETVHAYGESEWSQHMLDDGTLSGARILGYKIKFNSGQWYIDIPFGGLTKFDKSGKEIFHESGEWTN